jgi:hypothetical protein
VRVLVTGVVLLVLAALVGAGAGVLGATGVRSALDVRGSLVLTADAPGSGAGQLAPGDHTVLALGRGLVDRGGRVQAQLRLTGPDGTVDVRSAGSTASVSTPDEDAVLIGVVTVPTAGRYTLEARSPSEGVTAVGLRPGSGFTAPAASIIGLVAAILVAGLLGLLGTVLTVVGAVRRSRAR